MWRDPIFWIKPDASNGCQSLVIDVKCVIHAADFHLLFKTKQKKSLAFFNLKHLLLAQNITLHFSFGLPCHSNTWKKKSYIHVCVLQANGDICWSLLCLLNSSITEAWRHLSCGDMLGNDKLTKQIRAPVCALNHYNLLQILCELESTIRRSLASRVLLTL